MTFLNIMDKITSVPST